jgi:hypothetical protein
MMPYVHFRQMSDKDLASVIVYIRSLPAVRNELPKTEIIFPVKYLIQGVPEPVNSLAPDLPSTPSQLVRGAYLVNMGACSDCHTPQEKGQVLPGMIYAGGSPVPGPWGNVVSANITPDASGIAYYDESVFLEAMHTGSVKARRLSPIMPTNLYGNLNDDDLRAIFAYCELSSPSNIASTIPSRPHSASSAANRTARATPTNLSPRQFLCIGVLEEARRFEGNGFKKVPGKPGEAIRV